MSQRAVTYASYLKVPELLALQQERSEGATGPEHDELLFIVVHQVYELWFKQLHHELLAVRAAMERSDTDTTLHLLNRVLKILKTLVAQDRLGGVGGGSWHYCPTPVAFFTLLCGTASEPSALGSPGSGFSPASTPLTCRT
jgi:hypothetical protein